MTDPGRAGIKCLTKAPTSPFMKMPRRDIEFKASDGTILRGWLYTPADHSEKAPCVILSHGFSAVKEMDLDLFAEYFTAHLPITALVFDNRCLGASDGTPRFELIPSLQMSDIQDAITYAQSLNEVNSEKIAIWGSSYSGANVLQVAAFDRRVKAVLAQNPLTSGWDNFRRLVSSGVIPQLDQMFAADRAARMRGEAAGVVPVVTEDPHGMSAIPGMGPFEFFEESRKTKAPSWVNLVTIKSVELISAHNPQPFIPLIAPTPLLLTVAVDDTLTPSDIQLAAFNEAREPKQLQLVPGDHFAVYGGQGFERNVATQTEFLKKWLF